MHPNPCLATSSTTHLVSKHFIFAKKGQTHGTLFDCHEPNSHHVHRKRSSELAYAFYLTRFLGKEELELKPHFHVQVSSDEEIFTTI